MSLFKPNLLSPNFEQVYEGEDIKFSFDVNTNISNVRGYQIIVYDNSCLEDLKNEDDYIMGIFTGNFKKPLTNGDRGCITIKARDLYENNSKKLELGKTYIWKIRLYEDHLGTSGNILGNCEHKYNFLSFYGDNYNNIKNNVRLKQTQSGQSYNLSYDMGKDENDIGIGFKDVEIKAGDKLFFTDVRETRDFREDDTLGACNICFVFPDSNETQKILALLKNIDYDGSDCNSVPKFSSLESNIVIEDVKPNTWGQNMYHVYGDGGYLVERITINNVPTNGKVKLRMAYVLGHKIRGESLVALNFISGSTNKVMWIETKNSEVSEGDYFGYDVYSDYLLDPEQDITLYNMNNSDFMPFGSKEDVTSGTKTFTGVAKTEGEVIKWSAIKDIRLLYDEVDSNLLENLGVYKLSNLELYSNGIVASSIMVNGDPLDIPGSTKYRVVNSSYFVDFEYHIYVKLGTKVVAKTVTGTRVTDRYGNFLKYSNNDGRFTSLIVNDDKTFINMEGQVISIKNALFEPLGVDLSYLEIEENLISNKKEKLYSSNGGQLVGALEWPYPINGNTGLLFLGRTHEVEVSLPGSSEVTKKQVCSDWYKAIDILGRDVITSARVPDTTYFEFRKDRVLFNDELGTKKCYDIKNLDDGISNFITGRPDDPFIFESDYEMDISTTYDSYDEADNSENYDFGGNNPSTEIPSEEETIDHNVVTFQDPITISMGNHEYYSASIYDLKIATFANLIKDKLNSQEIQDKFYISGIDDDEKIKLNSGDMWIQFVIPSNGLVGDNGDRDMKEMMQNCSYDKYRKIISSGQEDSEYYITLNPYEGLFSCSNLNIRQSRSIIEEWYERIKRWSEYIQDNGELIEENLIKNLKYKLAYRQRSRIEQVNKSENGGKTTLIILSDEMLANKYQYGDKDNYLSILTSMSGLTEKRKYIPLAGSLGGKSICCTNLLNNKFNQSTVYIHSKDRYINLNNSYLYVYYSDDQKIEKTNNLLLIYPSLDLYFKFKLSDYEKAIMVTENGEIKEKKLYDFTFDLTQCSDIGYPADSESITSVEIYTEESPTRICLLDNHNIQLFKYSLGKLTFVSFDKNGIGNTLSNKHVKIIVNFNNISSKALRDNTKFRGGLQKILEYESYTGRVTLANPLPFTPNESWHYQVLDVYKIKMTSGDSQQQNERTELEDYLTLRISGTLGSPLNKHYEVLATNFSPYEIYSAKQGDSSQNIYGIDDSETDVLRNCRFFIQRTNLEADTNKGLYFNLFNGWMNAKVYAYIDLFNGNSILKQSGGKSLNYLKMFKNSVIEKVSDDIYILNCRYDSDDWPITYKNSVDVSPKHSLARPQTKYKLYSNYMDALPKAVFSVGEREDFIISVDYLSHIGRTVELDGLQVANLYDCNIRVRTLLKNEYLKSIENQGDDYKIKKYKYIMYGLGDSDYYYEEEYKYGDEAILDFYLVPNGRYCIKSIITTHANEEIITLALFNIDTSLLSILEHNFNLNLYNVDFATVECKKLRIDIDIEKLISNYIDEPNLKINSMQIYKKRIFEYEKREEVETYKILDSQIEDLNMIETICDYSVVNKGIYEYMVVIKTENNSYIYSSLLIKCHFDKYSLLDLVYDFKNKIYNTDEETIFLFKNNVNLDSVLTNFNTQYSDTMGFYGKINKGSQRFDNGSISFIVNDLSGIVNKTQNDSYISESLERWNTFLGNSRPKLLRDMKGNQWIILIEPNFSIKVDNRNKYYIITVQFSWKQIMDNDIATIQIKMRESTN